ncbi:MAG: MFS transporter [Deltaproteobacteria bacterium]|nr:MAG: MFS transporter [Deltaproteobacteria bacterium]
MTSRARRIGIQAPLGFSSGLPLYLTGSTLAAWLTQEGLSYKTIGAFALVSLPYNFKWLWAPAMDRWAPPLLGRRRGWMIVTQALLAIAIAALGAMDVAASTGVVALLAFAVAFLSASQDVVVDAYRTEVLPDDERGRGTGAYVGGYRIGMLASGFAALLMASTIGWRNVYWILAALMTVGVAASLAAPAPPAIRPPASLRAAIVDPLADFFSRRGAVVALAFVMLYKLGDAVAGQMVVPFLLREQGFSLADIAWIQKLVGSGATIVGVAAGGAVIDRVGTRRGLLYFGAAQALTNAGYALLAVTGRSHAGLIAAVAVDNFCNALGTAAFVAYLMSICNRRYSATQYALLSSASSVLGRVLNATSGYVIDLVGWVGFFSTTIALAAPALLLWRRLPHAVAAAPPKTDRPSIGALARGFAGLAAAALLAYGGLRLAARDWGHASPALLFGLGLAAFAYFGNVLRAAPADEPVDPDDVP